MRAYSHGILHVNIPYNAHAGAGQLTMEVLDPEDHVVGRTQSDTHTADVKLQGAVAIEDLVWYRLRYRAGSVERTESIAQILRTPVIHVLGQQSYLAGWKSAAVTGGGDRTRRTSRDPRGQFCCGLKW